MEKVMSQIPQKIMERIVFLIIVLIFLAFMGIAGKMDYEDAVLFERTYKENVCAGIHPDYKQWGVKCEGMK
jgi:hypothetical protein